MSFLLNCEHPNAYRLLTAPLDYWGESQSGPSTSTFNMVRAGVHLSSCNSVDIFPQGNVYTYHQPGAGPARTGQMSTGRFQPYGMSRSRPNHHRNAEAGPSTLVPSPAQTQQPSGGIISEPTADADKTQSFTEEDKAAVSKFYCSHIPHVTEWSSASDVQTDQAPPWKRTTSPPPHAVAG